jgi:hypothetical protein
MVADYEDNFGFRDIDGQEERACFDHVKRESVPKTCDQCQRRVRLLPPKRLCELDPRIGTV